ncbi:MAG: 4-hydroxy-tetrahydrodipicolinate synthase, partial [Alphaproteobacteria bacterium]|nr:4-hydroxy-tetrahydrodipicolinate synthase [Alphaproteobacteria bacterium]
HAEHRRVTELCIEAVGGRVPVIAGAGSNSTEESASLTRHAQQMGADAALVVTPYYNKPTQAGLYAHFEAVAASADIPIIIYNIPGRSVVNMSVETMARLAEIPNIVGVKDATADLTRPMLERLAIGEDFCLLSGEDGTALAYLAHGGHGCISVTSNIAPALCAAMHEAWQAGDAAKALSIHDTLMPLHDSLFVETSPAPVKHAASLLGLCSPELRLPMVGIGEATADGVTEALKAAGLLGEGVTRWRAAT